MDLELARDDGPAFPIGGFLGVLGQKQHAGAPKAGVGPGLFLQLFPEAQSFARKRNLRSGAALLAAPAPVAARLLARDMPLLDQRDRQALAGEMIGAGYAEHAADDDHH